ncbi:MAG TPA: hypothetical protein VMV05_08070 [bacterium]|nr:hypothetical protein [bacterium]
MPACLGCGKELAEISRKIIKGEMAAGVTQYKAVYACSNRDCGEKGKRKSFLDDGLVFVPLPEGH